MSTNPNSVLSLTTSNVEPTAESVTLSPITKPKLTSTILISVDAVMLLSAAVIALLVRVQFEGGVYWIDYLPLLPVILVCIPCFACAHLYPNIPLTPARELRTMTMIITLFALSLATLTYLLKEGPSYSRAVLIGSWALAIVLVPIGRSMVRTLFSTKPWWGHNAIIIGSGSSSRAILRSLLQRPELGIKPIAIVRSPYSFSARSKIQGIPIIDDLNTIAPNEGFTHSAYAIIATTDFDADEAELLLKKTANHFRATLVLPALGSYPSLWIRTTDIDGQLSLKIQHHLLNRYKRMIKYALETFLILAMCPIVIPLFTLICVLIKLDSRGPVFYLQPRVGKNGKLFNMIKFRTMRTNADALLDSYLEENPAQRMEWMRTHKLKNDPRITRVGKLLRKSSLDELPQLYNVIFGDMALVGPRPIFTKDIKHYQQNFVIYKQVRPGITGMWQTHGRNTLTHPERVQLDVYYVQNWSVWLDLHLLIKTFSTVLLGRGAY
ncbi:undecaprenyl-phosphate galactose phosphotransferase WbaP [Planctomycetota bacterium]|nr:undecaprenyl-phosphate galactose phosphotransferase WbaP [Planctomycetota bacterium]